MPIARPGYRATVLALGALTAGTVAYAVAAAGVSPSEPASSCRASVLRISLAGQVIAEPIIANDPDAPCAPETAGIGTLPTDPIPVELTLLDAETQLSSPQAHAGVADVTLRLSDFDPSLPDIHAAVLQASASATCQNGNVVRSGTSRVVGLDIDGQPALEIPDTITDDHVLDIDGSPLLTVHLNETDTSVAGTLTQRALHITALPGAADLDIVVSEASVDTTGNPCSTTTSTTGTTGPTTGTTGPSTGTTGPSTGTTGPSTGTTGPSTGTTGPSTGTTGPSTVTTGPTTGGGEPIVGWMTGGGQIGSTGVSHGFVLPCTLTQKHPGPALTINAKSLGTFHLDELTSVSCTEHSNIDQENPEAGFDTITGTGTGTCKGQDATVSFTFVDGGEPNDNKDRSDVTVSGGCSFHAAGPPVNGNHQAHRGNNPPA
jgi:hypothetical protein